MRKHNDDGLTRFDLIMTILFVIFGIASCVLWDDNGDLRYHKEKEAAVVEVVSEVKTETKVPVISTKEEYKEPVIEWNASDRIPLTAQEQEDLYNICQRIGVPMAYCLAIIESETNFDGSCVGSLGEVGLFQIHPVHWGTMTENGIDVHTTSGNMEAGATIIRDCFVTFRDLEAVTMGFKCGKYRAIELISEGVRLEVCKKVTERSAYYEEILAEDEVGYIAR